MPKLLSSHSKSDNIHPAHSRSAKDGLLPGTPLYIGKTAPVQPTIKAFIYDKNGLEEHTLETLEGLDALNWPSDNPDFSRILWLQIDGLADVDLLLAVGKRFNIHALTIEDILNTEQRTKLEDFDSFLFVVMKMLECRANPAHKKMDIESEQVSIVVGKNYLITCLEDPGDVFDLVRMQLRENHGKIRRLGSDYLLYSLMDAVVDRYFAVIEEFGETIEQFGNQLVRQAEPRTLKSIHRLRQQAIALRRILWPLREVVGHLQRGQSELIDPQSQIYFRDVYDHTIEVLDNIETNRDILAGQADLYLSASSYQLNVVMKLLTMISTIFIPLTFITSVYGMNFDYMPELRSPFGYYAVWAVMLTIGISMLLFFQRKKWF